MIDLIKRAFAVLVLAAFYLPAQAEVVKVKPLQSFLVDLQVGQNHLDVKNLQIYLNKSGFPVADTSVGSNGLETDYFGVLTQKALIKFQNHYAADILAPLGLVNGTGNLHVRTRNFINSFAITTDVVIDENKSSIQTIKTVKRRASGTNLSQREFTPTISALLQSPLIVLENHSNYYLYTDGNLSRLLRSDSDGRFSFSSSNPLVAVFQDNYSNTYTMLGAGTSTITVWQEATSTFGSAVKTALLTVVPWCFVSEDNEYSCLNGGVCNAAASVENGALDGASCSCPVGIGGQFCEVTTCASLNFCNGNGSCSISEAGPVCACTGAFSGGTCLWEAP
jgi:peptidoglycan hydrolase-like protein with peptidoglycan-binding domain